jgi:hypothetical protein
LASLLPTPTYAQYACTTVPFLIFTALELVPVIGGRLAGPGGIRYRNWAIAGVGVLVLAFVAEGAHGVQRAHTRNVSESRFYDQVKPSAMEAMADLVDAETTPGEQVLSFRPLYIFLSDADPVPGFENDEAPVAVDIGDISTPDADRLNLISNDRLEAVIRSHDVRLVVGPGDSRLVWGSAGRPWEEIVREAGYEPLASRDGITIWMRPEGRPSGADR